MFDQFKTEWLGKRVADPLLAGDHPYQCVSFVKQYLRELFNIEAGWWGDAIDYWTKTNPALLQKFTRLQTAEVLQGDIVILNGLVGNPYGHIGLATGAMNATQFEMLEQNGQTGEGWGEGGDAIRTRWINKSRVAGLLRPVPVAATLPYTITPVDPYKVDVIAGHQKWDLSHPDFASVAGNPVLTLNQQTTITVAAELHHKHIGDFVYLLEDPNVPQGYNRVDTVPYVAPVPVYVPPAAPVPVPLATKVTIVTDVPYYSTSTNAQNAYKEAGRLPAGQYYQIAKDFGMLNLSTDNTKDLQHWVNPRDNTLPEPAPAPKVVPVPPPQPFMPQLSDADKATFSAFNADRSPVKFVMEDNYNFRDLNGYSKKTVLRKTYDEVDMSGTFYHEGREWTRVHVTDTNGGLDINRWFAIPTINAVNHTPYIIPYDKMYSTQKTAMEQVVYNPNTPYTKFIQFGATVDVLYDKAIKTIDGIFRTKHK